MLRMSTLFLRTLREDPADAEVPSHRLLVRAGYVRRVAPGIYTWLPLGLKVLRPGRGGRARGDGPDGRPGGAVPGAAAPRALRDLRPLDGVRRPAVPAQGPQGRGVPARADPRGAVHDPGQEPVLVVQGPAGRALPDPDEVPRRGAPAGRRAARARVPHEGQLLLRRRRRGAADAPTTTTASPTSASSSGSAWTTGSSARSAARWAAAPARSSSRRRRPGRTPSSRARRATTPPTPRRWRCAVRPSRTRHGAAAAARCWTPPTPPPSPRSSRSCSDKGVDVDAAGTLKNVVVHAALPGRPARDAGRRRARRPRGRPQAARGQRRARRGRAGRRRRSCPAWSRATSGPQGLPEGIRYVVDPLVVRGSAWVTGANEQGRHAVSRRHGPRLRAVRRAARRRGPRGRPVLALRVAARRSAAASRSATSSSSAASTPTPSPSTCSGRWASRSA